MSRHRNIRSLDYKDELHSYDEVYGHSVEDDCCISPSDAAQFMYDRTRQPQMSVFFNEEDIAEEDESEGQEHRGRQHSESYHRPVLNELDEAKLRSCLDEIRDVLGDSISENVLVETVLLYDFNVDKTLDAILSNASSTGDNLPAGAPKPQREKKERLRDDNFMCPDCSLFHLINEGNLQKLREKFGNLEICNTDTESFKSFILTELVRESNSLLREGTRLMHVGETNALSDMHPPRNRNFSMSTIPCPSKTMQKVQSGIMDGCKPLTDTSGNILKCFDPGKAVGSPVDSGMQPLPPLPPLPQRTESSRSHFNIPKFPMKTRKNSDKENVENCDLQGNVFSPLETLASRQWVTNQEVEHVTPVLMLQNAKQARDEDGIFCIGNRNVERDDDVSSSPLAVFATQHREKRDIFANCHIGHKCKMFSPAGPKASHANHDYDCCPSLVVPAEAGPCEEGTAVPSPACRSHSDEDSDDSVSHCSPLMKFACRYGEKQKDGTAVREEDCKADDGKPADEGMELSLLSDTVSDRLNLHSEEEENVEFSSLASLGVRHSTEESEVSGSDKPQSLSDLLTHHLSSSPSCWTFNVGDDRDKKCVTQMDVRISKSASGRFIIPSLGGSMGSKSWDTKSTSFVNCTPDMSSLQGGKSFEGDDDDDDSDDQWEIDLSNALCIPGAPAWKDMQIDMRKTMPKLIQIEVVESSRHSHKPCLSNASSILTKEFPCQKKFVSPLGRALCRKWRHIPPSYRPSRKRSLGKIVPFLFNTPSPDDKVKAYFSLPTKTC